MKRKQVLAVNGDPPFLDLVRGDLRELTDVTTLLQ